MTDLIDNNAAIEDTTTFTVADIKKFSIQPNEVLLIRLPCTFSFQQVQNFVRNFRGVVEGIPARVFMYHGDILFEKLGFDEVKEDAVHKAE